MKNKGLLIVSYAYALNDSQKKMLSTGPNVVLLFHINKVLLCQ